MINEKKNPPSNQIVIDNEKIVDILLHAATREEVKSVETSLREEIKQVETKVDRLLYAIIVVGIIPILIRIFG